MGPYFGPKLGRKGTLKSYIAKILNIVIQPKVLNFLTTDSGKQCRAVSDCSWGLIRVFTVCYYMSLVVRKPAFCICENKDADQLRGNREADQRLCFRHTDSTITLLPKSEISRFLPFSVAVQPGLCRTWSDTPKTGFLRTRLISASF